MKKFIFSFKNFFVKKKWWKNEMMDESKSQFSKFNVTNHLSYRLKKKREPIFNRIDLVNHSISSSTYSKSIDVFPSVPLRRNPKNRRRDRGERCVREERL